MRTALICVTLAVSAGGVLANGGGYTAGVKFTGSVAPFQPEGCEKVQIRKEDLNIVLGEKSAAVTVRYEMQNVSGDTVQARFGFPVEAYREMTGIGGDDGTGQRTKELNAKEVAGYCRNYKVVADGKELTAKFQTEPANEGKVPDFPGMEVFKGVGGWMVSEAKFPKGGTVSIQITFDSAYDESSYSVSDSGFSYPDKFRYRLSTGGVWSGPIAEGTVRVLVNGANPSAVSFKAPANKFKPHADGGWVWGFKNLEPTLADDIEIHATEEHYSARDYTDGESGVSESYERVGKKWFWQHHDYKATASSTLKGDKEHNYSADGVRNKNDYDEKFRAWVEGREDDGFGESLTLTQNDPSPVTAIFVRPGYGKDKKLFKANNRPKSLKITLNGNHTFVADLKDEDSAQRIPVTGYPGAVKTIKIEIADVYRGTSYRDTAIAHVSLLRPLSKEPKFQGPR